MNISPWHEFHPNRQDFFFYTLLYGGSFSFLVFSLFTLSRVSYPYFHTIIEFLMVAIGGAIFLIAVNSYRYSRNDFFLFLGIVYFFVSILGFVHSMSYKGVQLVSGFDANVPTQLWIASRYVLALGFVAAPFLLGRRLKLIHHHLFAVVLSAVVALMLLSILWFQNFPAAFVEGSGLTAFKTISEYVVSILFIFAIAALARRFQYLDPAVYYSLIAALVLMVAAELLFTEYQDVFGYSNMAGHILLAISSFFIYRALIRKTLSEPFATVFRDLRTANERLYLLSTRDELTGLDNRRHILEQVEHQFDVARRFNKPFTLIMIDIDDFKTVNDTYGHLRGNQVIQEFARRVKASFRAVDLVGRYGGDEFIICPIEITSVEAERTVSKLIQSFAEEPIMVDGIAISIGSSAGICQMKDETEVDQIIQKADDKLYESKRSGKNTVTC